MNSESNSIVGCLIGLCVISCMVYEVMLKRWIAFGVRPPWPFALFFVPFYAILIYRLVRGIRDLLHPERVRAREKKPSRKRKGSKKTSPALFKVVILLMSLAFMGVGGGLLSVTLLDAHRARSWQATTARVVSSTVKSHSSSKGGTTYSPKVCYTYSIDGVSYTSDRYSTFGISTSDYAAQKEKARQYRPGQEITIYYDPSNPSESVIERVTSVPFFLVGFFGIFLGAGVLLFVVWIRTVVFARFPAREMSFFNTTLKRTLPNDIKSLAFFTGLWNLFSWVFVGAFFEGGSSLKSLVSGVVLIFPVIGLGFAVYLGRKILSYWRAPQYALAVTCPRFRPGETMQVSYSLKQAAEVRRFVVDVVSVNLDFRTDASSLAGDPQNGVGSLVCDVSDAARLNMGAFSFTIPEVPPANRRSWKLRLTTYDAHNRRTQAEYLLVERW